MEPADSWTISYASSATILAQLMRLPKKAAPRGLLAVGDPVFGRPVVSADPGRLPDYGLLATTTVPGGNAARHGLKPGEVLLYYDRTALSSYDDLKVKLEGSPAVPITVWRNGRVRELAVDSGELGRFRPATRERCTARLPPAGQVLWLELAIRGL